MIRDSFADVDQIDEGTDEFEFIPSVMVTDEDSSPTIKYNLSKYMLESPRMRDIN
jgi:hypothetical protein